MKIIIGRSAESRGFNAAICATPLTERGWNKRKVFIAKYVDDRETQSLSHEIDHFNGDFPDGFVEIENKPISLL